MSLKIAHFSDVQCHMALVNLSISACHFIHVTCRKSLVKCHLSESFALALFDVLHHPHIFMADPEQNREGQHRSFTLHTANISKTKKMIKNTKH